MPLLGAHMSIAGGLHKAVEAAAALGMETVQVFTHSPSQWAVLPVVPAAKESHRDGKSLTRNGSQWRAKPITAEEEQRFFAALQQSGITHPLSHSSYLINLGSSQAELWERSVEALVVELQRADQLGIAHVVVHPGAAVGATDQVGLDNIVRGLDAIHAAVPAPRARLLLENTAGQGSCLGWRFEHLGYLLQQVRHSDRLDVCFDTCHAFAAGYPLADRRDYLATFREFERWVGTERIRAFHLNDSKRELGSRVDRHEHIGQGRIGLEAFRHLLRDKRFRNVPMYLETPKGKQAGRTWDEINLARLRELAADG